MTEIAWQDTVVDIPSLFGKLVYVAALRDENKGTYRHYGLEKEWPADDVHETLRQAHRVLFYEWISMALQLQVQDMLEYLAGLEGTSRTVLATWRKVEPFLAYVPADSGRGDRELFVTDLRILVDLLLKVEENG